MWWRGNFRVKVAQIAAVALIIDYIVTVAVQVVAGNRRLDLARAELSSGKLPLLISTVVVALMCYGNLRGICEAGRTFAIPTYLFVTATGSLIIIGLIRAAVGQLHAHAIPRSTWASCRSDGRARVCSMAPGSASAPRAFANGGSSLTGLEAISNGVSTFRQPEGPNARRVLVIMALILGSLVTGVSLLAHITHAVPYVHGHHPTLVLSQEAQYVFGSSLVRRARVLHFV